MSVRPKHYRRSAAVAVPTLKASELLQPNHPLHGALEAYSLPSTPTLRKAREFLAANPHFRQSFAVAKAA